MTERAERGRFAEGNPGGPGRPPRATETAYLEALTEIVTPERWRAICERAASDAEAGDAKAREWIAKYVIGAGDVTVWKREADMRWAAMFDPLGSGLADNPRDALAATVAARRKGRAV